jgi:LPPG:FO 2-phospho-L-lactate transferase
VRVTALAGGTGAAKLLRGIVACIPARELTVIGNTGDDTEIWGLHVSPDLDTVMYALGGRLDTTRGWGLRDETFRCLDAVGRLGGDTWFQLGDRDLATHLIRTRGLRDGRPLSQVTEALACSLDLTARILPMSDDPVRTRVRTPAGWLGFQEFFVRERAKVEVLEVDYVGAPEATPGPGVVEAIGVADVVVVCPSNPVTSVGPILAVPGIVAALSDRHGPTVAVSPIVAGAAVSGPAGELLRARGLPVSPLGIARAYAPWLHILLVDASDAHLTADLRDHGVTAVVAHIMMSDAAAEIALARAVLSAAARTPRDGDPTAGTARGGATPHLSQPPHDPTQPPRPRYQ